VHTQAKTHCGLQIKAWHRKDYGDIMYRQDSALVVITCLMHPNIGSGSISFVKKIPLIVKKIIKTKLVFAISTTI
jgi:hypothetical protein